MFPSFPFLQVSQIRQIWVGSIALWILFFRFFFPLISLWILTLSPNEF